MGMGDVHPTALKVELCEQLSKLTFEKWVVLVREKSFFQIQDLKRWKRRSKRHVWRLESAG